MSEAKRGPLPPIPELPRRSLTPPARTSGTFTLESKTPARNATAASFAALASVFDALTPEERIDFIELAFCFKDLPNEFRKKMIEAAMLVPRRTK